MYFLHINYIISVPVEVGARGGTVGWGTALQARESRVRFPMVSLEFFMAQSFRPHYGPGISSASNRNEYQKYFLGLKAADAFLLKSGSLKFLKPSGPDQACNWIPLSLPYQ
jgi:hypothetical protein